MAYSEKDWQLVQSYYEAGLSLAEIVERENVSIKSRSQISKRAAKYSWIKSEEKKQLVIKETEAKQSLSEIKKQKDTLKETDIIVHNDLVNERLNHLEFFKRSTMKNLSTMMRKVVETITIQEHTQAQNALQKGKETILGKDIDTAIQINNTQQTAGDFKGLSDDELDTMHALLQKASA